MTQIASYQQWREAYFCYNISDPLKHVSTYYIYMCCRSLSVEVSNHIEPLFAMNAIISAGIYSVIPRSPVSQTFLGRFFFCLENLCHKQRCSQYIFDHTRFKKVYSLAQIMGPLFLHENCMISDTRKKDPALLHPT